MKFDRTIETERDIPEVSSSYNEGSDTFLLCGASASRSRSRPRRLLYGSTEDRRSFSVPLRRSRQSAGAPHTSKGNRTAGQQTRKIVEDARKSLFHGSFTSSHGTVFIVPPNVGRHPALDSGAETCQKCSDLTDSKVLFGESVPGLDALKAVREGKEVYNGSLHSLESIEDVSEEAKLFDGRPDELSAGHLYDTETEKGQLTAKCSLRAIRRFLKHLVVLAKGSDTVHVGLCETCKEPEENARKDEEDEESEDGTLTARKAMINLLSFAAPAAVTIGLTFALFIVPLAFVGSYLGERNFTGVSVASFIVGMVAVYPINGLMYGMDTLCSHEFGRDSMSQELGLLLQRGILVNLFFLIPVCLSIYKLDSLLVTLYGPLVAQVATDFLYYIPAFLVPVMMFVGFTKFLSNQMQPQIPMTALAAGFIVTPIVQMKLTPMGVRYTMIGMAITAWWQLLVVVVLTLLNSRTRHTLGSISIIKALRPQDVKEYLKLSIPSAIFVATEASTFDVTGLLCAHFGEGEGAAWSGIMNALIIFVALSGGLSASACANIGRCIGSHKPLDARMYVAMTVIACLAASAINSFILLFFFDRILSLFGTEGTTLALARKVLFVLPFFHIADSVQYAYQGIFSGIGKNHIGAIILLVSLWGVGIPLAFFLGLYMGYGILGVAVGITIGLCIEAPTMVIASCFIDYKTVCDAFAVDDEGEKEEEEEMVLG